MKSQELRIGNWVNKDLSVDDMVTIQVGIGDLLSNEVIENLYPIPLTEEWLAKFGLGPNIWFCDSSYYIFKDSHFEIHKEWSIKVRNVTHTTEIEFGFFKYVHQLQNLYYALTGEEL